MRVGIWLLMGVLVYIFYGRTHSSLKDVVYVPVAQADEMYRMLGTELSLSLRGRMILGVEKIF
jgi:hypothetical protein